MTARKIADEKRELETADIDRLTSTIAFKLSLSSFSSLLSPLEFPEERSSTMRLETETKFAFDGAEQFPARSLLNGRLFLWRLIQKGIQNSNPLVLQFLNYVTVSTPAAMMIPLGRVRLLPREKVANVSVWRQNCKSMSQR